MHSDELGLIYESLVLNEGIVSNLGKLLKTGLEKGLEITDIVKNNLNEFVAIAGLLSTTVTMQKVHTMYQNHPEILQKHGQYAEKAVKEIAEFLNNHPEIVQTFIKKS